MGILIAILVGVLWRPLAASAATAGHLEFVVQWDVGANGLLTCTLIRTPSDGGRLLTFKQGVRTIYEYRASDRLIAMWPLKDVAGSFLTVWQGGSAYHVRVFRYREGRVTLALDTGSAFFPSLLDVDGDGSDEIIVGDNWHIQSGGARPVKAAVHATAYGVANDRYVQVWEGDLVKVRQCVAKNRADR
jgi:hypothetical protein